ncbi:unnamed protein product [Acanthosepion pharaonis]|uniref:Uncharacterized protein n=1 Tax=Acanthosepion pharaonis TaxID=158019 RepID=A0A812CG68_ACAPH|nr:unnamed protein product [Sepia pharaonis]
MSRFLGNLFTLFVPFCFLLSITAGHPEEENDDAKEKLLLTVVRIEQEYAHLNTEVYRSNVVHFVTGIPLTTQVDKKVFKESHHHKNFPVPEAIHESQVTDIFQIGSLCHISKMGCQHWIEYKRLFMISNFLLVTMLLCLTSFFLPYWYIVDFYPQQNKTVTTTRPAISINQPTTTTVSTISSSTPLSTTSNIFGRRRKREALFEQIFRKNFLSRRKRQAINRGKIFDDLVIPKVHVGLFYMLYPYADFMKLEILNTKMVSLIHLEKNSPDFVVPKIMYIAQIFYSFGMLGLTISTATIFILACRKYSSVVGEIALGGTLMFSTLMLIVGVILAGIHKEGPLFAILCTVLTWSQACSTCMDVEEIRKQQMKEIIAPDIAYQPLVTENPYKTGHDNRNLSPDTNIMRAHQEKAREAGISEEFSI